MRHPHGRGPAWLVAAGVALIATACNPTPSRGTFDGETLLYAGCEDAILPWEPSFSTIDQFEDQVTIRLEAHPGGAVAVDTVVIQVDRDYIRSHVGERILLGLPEDNRLRARATLGFFASCPRSEVTPELIGTIRFDFFEPNNDGQITGRIQAPVVVDSRTGDVIGANIDGYFSFKVQKGRPYTNFTGPGQE